MSRDDMGTFIYYNEDYMTTVSSTKDFFSTPDLSIAAYLVTIGFPLNHLDKSNRRKVVFSFYREDGLDEAIQAFWVDADVSVSPLQYFNNIKTLKNRIYSE